MNLKYFLLGGVAVLLGFLLYPRGEEAVKQEFVKPQRQLDNEPLHYTDILRTTPIYATYDLGYVYKIDKIVAPFDNPNESGPKQFDLLVQNRSAENPLPSRLFLRWQFPRVQVSNAFSPHPGRSALDTGCD